MHVTQSRLDHARAVVARHVAPTPCYPWPLLAEATGARVWVKHEEATPVGSFKVRGGLVYLERLRDERPHVHGIVSATRGNHGQSLAFAGRAFDVDVAIVVPESNSVEKNAAMVGFGAELIVEGRDFQASAERAADLAAERGWELVPAFHPDLVAGVATYAAELFEQAGELDVVYVPVGMGSGVNAVASVRDLLGYRTEVVGVVAAGAPAVLRSVEVGRPVSAEAKTFIDGVAVRIPDPTALEVLLAGGARIMAVDDDAAAEAMRTMFRTTHHLPEPAGAVALAGLLAEVDERVDQRVGVVLSGSNMDTTVAAAVLAGRTPEP